MAEGALTPTKGPGTGTAGRKVSGMQSLGQQNLWGALSCLPLLGVLSLPLVRHAAGNSSGIIQCASCLLERVGKGCNESAGSAPHAVAGLG
jgi:hypothetical protein